MADDAARSQESAEFEWVGFDSGVSQTGVDETAELESVGFDSGVSQTGADKTTQESSDGAGHHTAKRTADAGARVHTVGTGQLRRGLRRLVGALVLLVGLFATGGVYAMVAQADSSSSGTTQGDPVKGRELYSITCITCHGANLGGVKDRGPSLLGVGGAATYFQVSTGRMPLAVQGGDAPRKESIYTEAEVDALAAYVQSMGGGPEVPQGPLRDDSLISEGGELFRLNCASCHNFAGKGVALSAGKTAPSLNHATDRQLVTAMLTGPENMPVFSDNQITPAQKKAIITYIQTIKQSSDPGGNGLDRVGPVTEGLVIWVAGIGALMMVILWIGAKS